MASLILFNLEHPDVLFYFGHRSSINALGHLYTSVWRVSLES